jgi:hypothetical protein
MCIHCIVSFPEKGALELLTIGLHTSIYRKITHDLVHSDEKGVCYQYKIRCIDNICFIFLEFILDDIFVGSVT